MPTICKRDVAGRRKYVVGRWHGSKFCLMRATITCRGSVVTMQAATVILLALADGIGLGQMGKSCIFSPGVALRVWRGKEWASLLVCFSCDDLEINFYDASRKLVCQTAFDFSGNRRALLRLIISVLPSDRVFRTLSKTMERTPALFELYELIFGF